MADDDDKFVEELQDAPREIQLRMISQFCECGNNCFETVEIAAIEVVLLKRTSTTRLIADTCPYPVPPDYTYERTEKGYKVYTLH